MILAAVDTNVLASGAVRSRRDVAPVQFIDAWRAGLFTMVVSDYLLDVELPRTLAKPYFTQRLTQTDVDQFLFLLRTETVVTPIMTQVHGVATHREDDLILAAAVSARADYLVTGDTQLQRLGSYEGVTILSPRAFVDLLREQAREDDPT
jgi:putative PIN family toxin of toxin-antitoxin system